ncbi:MULTISPECIES: LacI family DNA-binding transcriptional regulator [Bacillaceae]|uniref:LacI family transcriptional regulator n=1 Tax=Evansella alkalicola TaxID=745819 RepID=A0ABS6JYA9_9BACI|nr:MULTISPECIES: LacI family DNA-binding transcriptional regulator [Bacillaceae]MBU9723572.1 LacI family transcriptional regulator [Bacillus alkalicola]
MGVTIKDIAKAAGVSYSTVSKALLNSPLVKEPTKKKIIAIAKELNYQPNAAARRLASKKSNTIGVVWPTIERVTLSALITKINEQLEAASYTTLLSINPVETAVTIFNQFQVDAILVFDDNNKSEYTSSSSVPVVSYGLSDPNSPYPIIDVNRKQAIHLAVEYLYQQGHRKISYIGNVKGIDRLQEEKVDSFQKSVSDLGIDTFANAVISVDSLDQYDGYLAAKNILHSEHIPTAIICGSQDLARGIIRATQELNVSIPEDISIISYDNIPQREDLIIPLSTVGVPLDTISEHVAKTLIDVINKEEISNTITLEPELKITNSCRTIKE